MMQVKRAPVRPPAFMQEQRARPLEEEIKASLSTPERFRAFLQRHLEDKSRMGRSSKIQIIGIISAISADKEGILSTELIDVLAATHNLPNDVRKNIAKHPRASPWAIDQVITASQLKEDQNHYKKQAKITHGTYLDILGNAAGNPNTSQQTLILLRGSEILWIASIAERALKAREMLKEASRSVKE